jgi:release factor glutamine methyltransferase
MPSSHISRLRYYKKDGITPLKSALDIFLPSPVKVHEAIQWAFRLFQARGFSVPRLDAEALLIHLLKVQKVDLYLDRMRQLNEEERAGFALFVQRRLEGEPVAQITGSKEFWSLDFMVNRNCLTPRPETEFLVERALEIYRSRSVLTHETFRIFEIGTGSGIISICLAREIPQASVIATDISLSALDVARENARRHGVSEMIEFLEGDLFAPVCEKKDYFDLIVSNPPYVAGKDLKMLPREILAYEPYHALYGGEDGLTYYQLIIPESIHFLREQGWIALEVGCGEADQVINMLRQTEKFTDLAIQKDFAGIPRIVSAQKNSLP